MRCILTTSPGDECRDTYRSSLRTWRRIVRNARGRLKQPTSAGIIGHGDSCVFARETGIRETGRRRIDLDI